MSNVASPRVPSAFRIDIQALRGLAILLVLLYHAKLGLFAAGYLGVDIFFVVSGYLITQVIKKDVELGVFSFAAFYFRRAKRLLPAAYVVFTVSALLSGIFLTAAEMQDFIKQLIGAVTFTGNIALWLQTGYFEGAAHLKPLLHVWSLSIEEQYYLLLPAALVLVPRRFWMPGAAFLLVASLALCMVLAPIKPSAVFYLLPTRGWELAVGSLGALILDRLALVSALSRLFWPAILLLIAVPLIPRGAIYPELNVILVCAATLVVILRRHPILKDGLTAKALANVGNFSYSLYLVHWPLFAFASNAYVSEVPIEVRVGLVVASIALGYLLYRYVELPVRRADIAISGRSVGAAAVTSLAIVTVGLAVAKAYAPEEDYAYVRRANRGFGEACNFDEKFAPIAACRSSGEPRMLVWGDSLAMHLVPGIAASDKVGVVQATKSLCGPFVGLAPFDTGDYPRSFADRCLRFNQSVLEYLASTPHIEVVVLSSAFVQYLDASAWGRRGFRSLSIKDGKTFEQDPGLPGSERAMRETVLRVRSLGKRVVVVAPPPSSYFDVGTCLERKASGKVILGIDTHCRIAVSDYHRHHALVFQFLARLPGEAGVNVVRFDEFLCSAQSCATELEKTFIYRDGGHFSHDGSRLVAGRMALTDRLLSSAN
jgi:peptidoglycan/LPS O-acetylase OafA/YrhL